MSENLVSDELVGVDIRLWCRQHGHVGTIPVKTLKDLEGAMKMVRFHAKCHLGERQAAAGDEYRLALILNDTKQEIACEQPKNGPS